MKLQLFEFKCGKCGTTFKRPKAIFGSYGEFILYSRNLGELAYLNALEDRTYDEVHGLIAASPRVRGMQQNAIAKALRQTFGNIACDFDSEGNPFQIGLFPTCPSCGSQNPNYWQETDPPEFVNVTIAPVTHQHWYSFSSKEKEYEVDKVLNDFGY